MGKVLVSCALSVAYLYRLEVLHVHARGVITVYQETLHVKYVPKAARLTSEALNVIAQLDSTAVRAMLRAVSSVPMDHYPQLLNQNPVFVVPGSTAVVSVD